MAVQAQFCSENLGLASYGSPQDWLMSSAFGIDDGLYFSNLQEPQQPITLLPQQQQQQGLQSLAINSYQSQRSSTSSGGNFTSMAFSQSLAALLEKQRREIDWVLQLQNERLRINLQEEARQQLAILLQRCESEIMRLLRQKDEHVAIATKKTVYLEDCLRRIEMENQTWQMKAIENEEKVSELNNTIAQVRERISLSFNGAHDAESVCECSNGGNREDENRGDNEEQSIEMACKACKARSACIVLLPCRHLCSCKSCEDFLGHCPVCESVKEASMEVFLA